MGAASGYCRRVSHVTRHTSHIERHTHQRRHLADDVIPRLQPQPKAPIFEHRVLAAVYLPQRASGINHVSPANRATFQIMANARVTCFDAHFLIRGHPAEAGPCHWHYCADCGAGCRREAARRRHLLELLVVFAVDGALVRGALAAIRFSDKSGGRMRGAAKEQMQWGGKSMNGMELRLFSTNTKT
jgi:hypothetical protein